MTKLSNTKGKCRHYNVPNNYFDHFADQLMEQIPKNEKQQVLQNKAQLFSFKKAAKYFSFAAAFTALFFSVQFFKTSNDATQTHPQSYTIVNGYSEDYIDDFCSYAMIDNNDIYEYLTTEFY